MSILFGFAGQITADGPIELRMTKTGKPWCGFTAVSGDGDGRQYIRLSVFDPELATRLSKAGNLKGVAIAVQGDALKLNSYTDSKGEQRHGLQGVAHKVERIQLAKRSTKKEEKKEGAPAAAANNSPPADDGEEKIPF